MFCTISRVIIRNHAENYVLYAASENKDGQLYIIVYTDVSKMLYTSITFSFFFDSVFLLGAPGAFFGGMVTDCGTSTRINKDTSTITLALNKEIIYV